MLTVMYKSAGLQKTNWSRGNKWLKAAGVPVRGVKLVGGCLSMIELTLTLLSRPTLLPPGLILLLLARS